MTTRWVTDPGALSRTTLDGFVVLGATADEPVLLTASAAAVWTLLGDAVTVEELVGVLAGDTGAPVDELRPVVTATLERLDADGAVHRVA